MVPPQDLSYRPRRNRRSSTVREAFRETILTPANFIYPIFVHDDSDEDVPILSMPGQSRLSFSKGMLAKVREARAAGVNQVVVFAGQPENGDGGGSVQPKRFGSKVHIAAERHVPRFGGVHGCRA